MLSQTHVTPMGELPGSVVINFSTIDAAGPCLGSRPRASGSAIEFAPEEMAAISAVVAATCTDAARDHGLIQPVTAVPDDADRDGAVDGRRGARDQPVIPS